LGFGHGTGCFYLEVENVVVYSFPIGMKPEGADSSMRKRTRFRAPTSEGLELPVYLFACLLPNISYTGSDATADLV
jgi:hypothetical protein